MMSRSTRSRQASVKLSSGDNEISKLAKLTKTRNTTNKLQSTKSSNNELLNADTLNLLQSPVLRDRTNLSKEPTTKFDILKKDLEHDADVKKVTSSKRTRITKPIINDTENIAVIVTKMKEPIRTTKKDGKVLGIKKPVIVSSSKINSVIKTSGDKTEIALTSRITRKSMKDTNSDKKLSAIATTRTKKYVSKQQMKQTEKTQTRKKNVSSEKLPTPSEKISKNNLEEPVILSPTRKTIGNKSLKRSVRLSTNKNMDKSAKTNVAKKFFKSKLKTPTSVQTHSKISPLKKPIIGKTRKATTNRKNTVKKLAPRQSPTFRLRQPTLKESFAKQSKKTLRPRKVSKNYCDESRLINDQEMNKNKLKNIEEKKGPVYKLLNNIDEKNTDKDKVYEFIFDSNDSIERATKKRKKRIIRKKPAKRAKIAEKKTESQPISSTELPVTKIPKPPTAITKSIKELDNKNISKDENKVTTTIAEVHLPQIKVSHEHHTDMLTVNNIPETTTISQTSAGPQINSVEKLRSEHCIDFTTPLQPRSIVDNTESLNKKSKFNLRPSMQVKSMMNAPLLRKSLSPITSTFSKENFETSSPWRAPIINTFSRVKNIYQSTPQCKKFAILLDKTSLHNTEQTQKVEVVNMNKISERNDENTNISMIQKSPQKNQDKNTSKSPRKFGTVISNIQEKSPIKQQFPQINKSKSPRKFGTVISNINESLSKVSPIINPHTKISTAIEPLTLNNSINTSIPMNSAGILSLSDESIHDKENSSPNNQSSVKSLRNRVNIPYTTPLRSKIIQESTASNTKAEIIEPQPGPSGLQKSVPSVVDDMWNSRQSNLNKFLNLPDMPTSTLIRTADGIFDDPHSTPMLRKKIKKLTTENLNVNNAFGFDDDNSMGNIDVSPINRCSPEPKSQIILKNKLETKTTSELQKCNDKNNIAYVFNPTRLSIGTVRKEFFSKKAIDKKKIDNKSEKQKVEDNHVHILKEDVTQAINFSDTFDNINNEADKKNVENVPLFVDLEPIHFTQPPRYSYGHKRKRNVSFNTSEETEEDEIVEDHPHAKKRKLGKAEREQKKIMDQWAKNMNNTFNEIEHYDLVVE